MKTKFLSFLLGLLCISGGAIVSCNQDDYYEDDSNCILDISYHTSLTRSASWDSESGQHLGDNPNNIPVYYGECELWAMVSIAKDNDIPITTGHKDNGDPINNTIGDYNFPAATAYETIKGMAMANEWPECDTNYNPIPNGHNQKYEGGAMPISIARSVGKEAGVIKGNTRKFSNYDDMLLYLQSDEWKEKNLDGKYMIHDNTDQHTTIGLGFNSDGILRYRDSSTHSSSFNTKKCSEHSYTIMW